MIYIIELQDSYAGGCVSTRVYASPKEASEDVDAFKELVGAGLYCSVLIRKPTPQELNMLGRIE